MVLRQVPVRADRGLELSAREPSCSLLPKLKSSMVGKPKLPPPSGEASQCNRPPNRDSFMPAKSDPAIDKLAIIQSRPSIPGTSALFEPLLVINSYRHRG